ncbi:MAG: PTS system mannose/fructose/sorbose family transporter subunit IID [Solobacterium sp.]|nr:PTS system mannose/fructose/sorbose family transporter subunit IID [Solobacterium sp.]
MVVGAGPYKNLTEAYPLDKKTLNKIVWRSFLSGFSRNGETGESIGWLWAIMPGLKKIHTDEQDLAYAMGHHLEYVETGSFLSTLAMGAVLSMEQCKYDPALIRSFKASVSAAADGIGTALFWYLIIPFTAMGVLSLAQGGSPAAALIYFLITAVLAVAARFAGMYIGYAQGTRLADTLSKKKKGAVRSIRLAGAFMIGAMIIVNMKDVSAALTMYNGSDSLDMASQLNQLLPGIIPLLLTWLMWHLLTRKNWSPMKCILLIVVIALAGAAIGLWAGTYEPLIHIG